MKKFFKILGIILASLIALIFIAALVIPIFFKDDIKKAIDKAIAKNVNAEVYYDLESLSISLFKNFPDVSVGMDDLGVIGVDEFEGDTLASIESFTVALDIMSVINGGEMQVNGVYLNQPYINGIVNANGKANWDIMKDTTSTTAEEDTATSSELDLSIEEIVITDGTLLYSDYTENTFAAITGLNHTSSIDIDQVYTLFTKTTIENMAAEYGGVEYLGGEELEANIDAVLDLDNSSFQFKDNSVRLNDFVLSFDGNVSMPDTNTTSMDLTFATQETSFKSILSLVPAEYLKDFENLKTSGTFAFNGAVKGDLTEETIPAFDIKLMVEEGFFQYPDLPEAVSNVNIDLTAKNESGIVEETMIDLKNLHAELGKNPIDAKVLVKNLRNYESVAQLKAVVNLADVMKIYPMEDLSLRGTLSANINAEGAYDSVNQQIPVVDANISLNNGYVKSSEFPEPIENIQMAMTASTDGSMQSAILNLKNLNFKLQEEAFEAKLYAKNLDNINYNADFNGVIDLDKILKIYPLEDMELGGRISINQFHTEGTMNDVEAENYQALKTSGNMDISNLAFSSPDLPQGFKIDEASMAFDPAKISVSKMNGSAGRSSYEISGQFSNYMGYLFSETDTVLSGTMNFYSPKFDVNEWMSDEESETTAETSDTASMEAVAIPGNIDFVLISRLDKVIYDNMDINNLKGAIIVRNERVTMDRVKFETLDGNFDIDGYYDAKNIAIPLYDMAIVMKGLSINDAYNTFESIQEMAPIAENMYGKFDMDIQMSGPMDSEMSPVLDQMNGEGYVLLHDAAIKGSETLNKIGKVVKKDLDNIQMKNQRISFTIVDGEIVTQPFDLNAGQIDMSLSGSSTLTGALDYLGEVKIPGGQVTKTLNSQLSQFGVNVGEDILIDLSILGTFTDPNIKITGTKSTGKLSDAKDKLIDDARERAEELKNEAEKRAREEAERLKKQAEERARQEVEKLKKQAEERAREKAEELKKKAEERAKEKAKEGLEGIFK